jgi:DNA-binding transcriptional LysR family regulator
MASQQNAAAAGIGLVVLPSVLGARDTRLKALLVDHLSIKRDLPLSVHEDLRAMKALMNFIREDVGATIACSP